jgi:hypothetical protein
MTPDGKRRSMAIAIAIVVVVVASIIAIPPIINPPPQRKLVYEYSTLNALVYPEYHRAPITIDASSDLYIEFAISNIDDSEHYLGFDWGMYECDLATFDMYFSMNTSDPIYQEFRIGNIRCGGGFTPQKFNDVFFEDAQQGSFTFVWWISARNKVHSWPLSFKIYLQYK